MRGGRRYLESLQSEVRQHEGDLVVLLQAVAVATPPPVVDVAPSVPPDDDGRRVWLRAMGELLEWPRLHIGLGAEVAAGQGAWMAFTAYTRNGEWVDRAVEVLGEIGGLLRDEIGVAAEAWWRRQEGRMRSSVASTPERRSNETD